MKVQLGKAGYRGILSRYIWGISDMGTNDLAEAKVSVSVLHDRRLGGFDGRIRNPGLIWADWQS